MKRYKTNSSLKYIRPITWDEIFATWKQGEENQEDWQKHWTERGFDSWNEWREAYAAPLHPSENEWHLFEIKNPLQDIPLFFGAPTKGWRDNAYNRASTMPLMEIVLTDHVISHPKIEDMKKCFPEKTILTGLVHEGNIILVEGMHRACALASWNSEQPFSGSVAIALTKWDEELPQLGGNYKKAKSSR